MTNLVDEFKNNKLNQQNSTSKVNVSFEPVMNEEGKVVGVRQIGAEKYSSLSADFIARVKEFSKNFNKNHEPEMGKDGDGKQF